MGGGGFLIIIIVFPFLLLLGIGTMNLARTAFSKDGLWVGFGLRLTGQKGKVVGYILGLLSLFLISPILWFLGLCCGFW